MAVVLYVLGVWFLVSVPLGLFVGGVCGLNHFSQDGGELLNPDTLAHGEAQADAGRSRREVAAA